MSAVDLKQWVGNTESYSEMITASHAKKIAMCFDVDFPQEGEVLPHLWHWAYFVDPYPLAEAGTDGHAKRGDFLPPADNRVRMWAGGRLEFLHDLIVGQVAERQSKILKIQEKSGSTGKLLFVTVQHDYVQNEVICIREEQDIVYRDPTPPKLSGTAESQTAAWSETINPSPLMLFRYSAVTYNGHRIHYDYPYVTQEEGYPGLVVHGPLIATVVLQAFKNANSQKKVKKLSFRGHRPLIAPTPFKAEGQITADGHAEVWAQQEGTVAQVAKISFE